MDSDLEPDVRNEASNEIRDQYLDAAKAKRMLGWSPAFTLDTSLRATIDWYARYFATVDGTPQPEARRG
jgi:CDP-glucose 4,6-dehydratase